MLSLPCIQSSLSLDVKLASKYIEMPKPAGIATTTLSTFYSVDQIVSNNL
jgi:hypothetical protein